jgi:hypothetical protein
MYKIIKDCSPYYITFTHDGFDDVVSYAKDIIDQKLYRELDVSTVPSCKTAMETIPTYRTRFFLLEQEMQTQLLNLTPASQSLNLDPKSLKYFCSSPGLIHPIHKDNPKTKPARYSLNYPVKILDAKCVTSWYSDLGIVPNDGSRIGKIIDPEAIQVLESMVLQANEAILLNTEIYHDWNNSKSTNERIVLTMRDHSPDVFFEDAKKMLFNL